MEKTFINHGQNEVKENSYWMINDGDIIITIGDIKYDAYDKEIEVITVQVNSSLGPIIESRDNYGNGMKSGQLIKVKTVERIIVCTIIEINPDSVTILLTENKLN